MPLTADDVLEVAKEAGLDDPQAEIVAKTYEKTFKNDIPSAGIVVDSKLLGKQLIKENADLKARIVDLMVENKSLKERLEEN